MCTGCYAHSPEPVYLFIYFFTGNGTQGLVVARQVLCPELHPQPCIFLGGVVLHHYLMCALPAGGFPLLTRVLQFLSGLSYETNVQSKIIEILTVMAMDHYTKNPRIGPLSVLCSKQLCRLSAHEASAVHVWSLENGVAFPGYGKCEHENTWIWWMERYI